LEQSPQKNARSAIIGCGYIAEFHAQALRSIKATELVAVCDADPVRAKSFADRWQIPAAFDSMVAMVPTDQHFTVAREALEAGLNVFIEKPMCTSVEEANQLLDISRRMGRRIGVNHNFLFTRAYERLRTAIKSGTLGSIDHLAIDYLFELPQLRSGPFNSWMLEDPANILLETGPHFLSILLDLLGQPEALSVTVDRKLALPGGTDIYRRCRIHCNVGRAAVDVTMNIGPGFSQRKIFARGLFGAGTVDLDANTCAIDRTPLTTDLHRYERSRLLAKQLRRQSLAVLSDYALTMFKLRRRGNPYQSSIIDSVSTFYSSLSKATPIDTRISGEFGRDVVSNCTKIISDSNLARRPASQRSVKSKATVANPTVLVIGASGFIGRELTSRLLASGYSVRAMSRGSLAVLESIESDRLDLFRGDARNSADLKAAINGIAYVYDLAVSDTKTWTEGERDIIEPARVLGEICLAVGVKRLVYTGTIASYYTGARAGTITEQTPLDPHITGRVYYARAKAMAEDVLLEMHRTRGLPVVIFRPGIVIGQGGTPFHWGVGRFAENSCEVWGDGTNKLPFVLVSDVADALLQGIQVPGIEGRSYNLVDMPLLNARDYMTEMQRLAGITIPINYKPIWRFYIADVAKWVVKLAVGHPDRRRIPSYRDWDSRTHRAVFDCDRAHKELAWKPASQSGRLIEEGIGGSVQSWLATWQ